MISVPSFARSYARALVELAQEKAVLEEVWSDLEKVVSFAQETPELMLFLENRFLPPSSKKKVIKDFFEGKINPLFLDFLLLLCDKRREAYLPQIAEAARGLVDEAFQIKRVKVKAAYPLDSSFLEELQSILAQKTGKTVYLDFETDASLGGGLLIEMDDLVYDASLSSRLSALYRRLKGNGSKEPLPLS